MTFRRLSPRQSTRCAALPSSNTVPLKRRCKVRKVLYTHRMPQVSPGLLPVPTAEQALVSYLHLAPEDFASLDEFHAVVTDKLQLPRAVSTLIFHHAGINPEESSSASINVRHEGWEFQAHSQRKDPPTREIAVTRLRQTRHLLLVGPRQKQSLMFIRDSSVDAMTIRETFSGSQDVLLGTYKRGQREEKETIHNFLADSRPLLLSFLRLIDK